MSIESLEAALPGLIAQRLEVPHRIDWHVLFGGLGTGLPDDYITLAESYPRLKIGQFLFVTSPAPGREAGYVEVAIRFSRNREGCCRGAVR
ncbi:hypothetical protein AB0J38_40025 [Streptomyces sp. NPDC050095]|uniref:hypothetical protein n=1 Tax=unclassified Streptomyces TaxID=2593676 RepID=UPI0034416C65